jgi:muramoyltetrapeptide carboxypeptidase
MLRPPALRPGALLGVCAPCGPVAPEPLQQGVAELQRLGFAVRLAPHVLDRTGFTAGAAADRLGDLHALLADDEVAGIVCARGGAGAIHLLPGLRRELLRGRSKVLLGASDVTALHAAWLEAGVTVLHGPLVAGDLANGNYDPASLLGALAGEPVDLPASDVLREGQAEGVLLGGCLSLLAALCGTPWALRPGDDTVLLLEDVNEPPYRLDRMLRQLRLAGAFERVRGVVIGEMKGCGPEATVKDTFLEALAGLDLPVAFGLPAGHTVKPHVTLPLGVRARLSCGPGPGRLELLEAAVA